MTLSTPAGQPVTPTPYAEQPSPEPPPSPEPVMRLAAGFMAAKHLFAASRLGLFEALADSPATVEALAARTGLTRRAARISVDAMVALGLVERDGEVYRNGDAAAFFLAGRTPADLRPFLRFWDRVSYPVWYGFADALATGPTEQITETVTRDPELARITSEGIDAVNAGTAASLAATTDFSSCQRLLDVGGGTGSWSAAVVRAHPHMRATVLELPGVAEVARAKVAEAGLASAVDVVGGDALAGSLPTGHDVFLLANILHYYSPEQNRTLLRHVSEVADPGARLLVADFWTDPTHTEPVIAALMAGEFAAQLENGDVYSVDEGAEMLEAAGWTFLEHRTLGGPVSVLTAEAS
jgi:precorrin-6B methylase 2